MNTAKAERLRTEAQTLLDRADQIDSIPEPTAPDGQSAVIQWTETFGGNTEYTYVAVNANGLWHVTGRHPEIALDWAGMVDRFHGIRHQTFTVATEWTQR